MVKRVLTQAGFLDSSTFRETRFLKPPKSTYAVYLDSCEIRGGDGVNLVVAHDYTIELYSYKLDPESEKKIENAFDALGISYRKEPRYWIDTEQLYQVIYEFSHVEKKGGK